MHQRHTILKELLGKLKNKEGIIIFLLLCGIIIIGQYNSWKDEISLRSNKKVTIGRVTGIVRGGRGGRSIKFEFYANGELFQASDPERPVWPEYVRESSARRSNFYPVEYDRTNPSNSKILITTNPLHVERLLRDGVEIEGVIENIFTISDSLADLYIKYDFLGGEFRFRTRLPIASLACGPVKDCRNSEIKIVVSKYFPSINDLYFKSYDRIAMERAKRRKK